MNGYEIQLFGEAPDPVARAWRNTEREAMDFAGRELRAGLGGAYNAAIWNSCPSMFLVLYINDLAQIFTLSDPVIYTRSQAAKLRRRKGA